MFCLARATLMDRKLYQNLIPTVQPPIFSWSSNLVHHLKNSASDKKKLSDSCSCIIPDGKSK